MGVLDYLEWLRFFRDNPNEAKRLDQCVNCKKLNTCNLDESDCEDENGMCKYHERIGS